MYQCFYNALPEFSATSTVWGKMMLRSETVSPNQVSDLLLGRHQKEKMIESLKTHFRLRTRGGGMLLKLPW